MKSISPPGKGGKPVPGGGVFSQDTLQIPAVASTIPAKSSVSGNLIDGPFGGKKPVG